MYQVVPTGCYIAEGFGKTKQQHAKDIKGLQAEIQSLKDEVQKLKPKRTAQIVQSPSSSNPKDKVSDDDDSVGDSSKQGRKHAEIEGWILNFEEEEGTYATYLDSLPKTIWLSTNHI